MKITIKLNQNTFFTRYYGKHTNSKAMSSRSNGREHLGFSWSMYLSPYHTRISISESVPDAASVVSDVLKSDIWRWRYPNASRYFGAYHRDRSRRVVVQADACVVNRTPRAAYWTRGIGPATRFVSGNARSETEWHAVVSRCTRRPDRSNN